MLNVCILHVFLHPVCFQIQIACVFTLCMFPDPNCMCFHTLCVSRSKLHVFLHSVCFQIQIACVFTLCMFPDPNCMCFHTLCVSRSKLHVFLHSVCFQIQTACVFTLCVFPHPNCMFSHPVHFQIQIACVFTLCVFPDSNCMCFHTLCVSRSKLKTPPTSPPTSAKPSGDLKPVSLSSEDKVSLPGTVESQQSSQSQFVHSLASSKSMHFPHSLSAELPETMYNQRRRLLPDCSNALHIIDGPEYRYFLGIVDFLTRWTIKQKAARLWKVIKYGCGEHSTMPPHYYSQRFVRFLTNRVT